MTIQLLQPVLEGGIKSIHFFNGRLLSGEDLSSEQDANREARELLGQALGDGVAFGLTVKPTVGSNDKQQPSVTVEAGLAVNRLGQPLRLTAAQDVALVRPLSIGSSAPTALFTECDPIKNGTYVAGTGVYLLTIRPASGPDGKAPVSGLGNLDAPCNARYQVAGVQFGLIGVPLNSLVASDVRLRNQLAYRCFGAGDANVSNFWSNPFGPSVTTYGLLDDLRALNCLQDDEVPLALLCWTNADGLKFIDMWSVRRRITHPIADTAWQLQTADRRAAEAEAMFLQFQDHMAYFLSQESNLTVIKAIDRFEYLPPVGLLPIVATNSPSGFNLTQVFDSLPCRPLRTIEGAQVPDLIRTSLNYPPLLLSRQEAIYLYRVRDNAQRVAASTNTPLQAYVIFTTGQGPDWAGSRYDLSHYEYGNYA